MSRREKSTEKGRKSKSEDALEEEPARKAEASPSKKQASHFVNVGASAGGLDASEKSFPNINSLRENAKAYLANDLSAGGGPDPTDPQVLIEELRIHQVELEMQNEELRKSYEALEDLKEIYKELYDLAPVGYLTLNEKNLILSANLTCAALLGDERSHLRKRRFSEFISPDCMILFYEYRRRCLDTGQRQTCELKLKGDADNPRYVHLEGTAIPDHEGHLNRIRIAMFDITDRKEADKQIRTLNRELLMSHEAERQMISRELHDRIGGDLAAVKLGYELLMEGHPRNRAERSRRASELSRILQDTILAVRDLSYALRPPEIEKTGLLQSLFFRCAEFSERTGIEVDFSSSGMERVELDDLVEINLYRIVQEALNNVRNHAQAGHVHITLSHSPPNIVLRVVDDGAGFDVEQRRADLELERRMGLKSMEERTKLLGGAMTVESSPMHGTRLLITIPRDRISYE